MNTATPAAASARADFGLRLLDMTSLCEALGLSRDTVVGIVKDPDQEFPAPMKIAKRRMWRQADVQRWLESRYVAA